MNHSLRIILLLLLESSTIRAQQIYLPFKRLVNVVDAYPMLSPDGKSVLFQSNRSGVFQLYTMNPDGTNLKQLTSGSVDYGTPVWSPDGKKIAFGSERDANAEIYTMDTDGKNQKRLTFTSGDDSHPKFSPDGQRIIFCSARNTPDLKADWRKQHIELFTMNIDGSDVKQVTNFKTVTTYPSISPDGTKLLFRKVINSPGFNWDISTAKRNSEVFIMNMDGSGERNLSNNPAYDGWPVWTPEGKIIFSSNRGGIPFKGQLYLINSDGTGLKQLTDPQHSFIQHSVSSDGKFIYCQDNVESLEFEFGGIAVHSFNQ